MRKRNHTVTIRMNNEEYNLLQNKVKESGRTQQEVVIKAIADLKIASTEEVEELKRLNQLFADILIGFLLLSLLDFHSLLTDTAFWCILAGDL